MPGSLRLLTALAVAHVLGIAAAQQPVFIPDAGFEASSAGGAPSGWTVTAETSWVTTDMNTAGACTPRQDLGSERAAGGGGSAQANVYQPGAEDPASLTHTKA